MKLNYLLIATLAMNIAGATAFAVEKPGQVPCESVSGKETTGDTAAAQPAQPPVQQNKAGVTEQKPDPKKP